MSDMKAALVDGSNVVVNVIVWDAQSVPPADVTTIPVPVEQFLDIGWTWTGGTSFTPPAGDGG